MCIGGGGSSYPQPQRPEFDDSPPVVTGRQTGVENPKDTKKATEELKIRRQKKEGTYVDPNLAAVEERLSRSGGGPKTKQQRDNLARNKQRAKDSALARKRKRTAPKGQGAGAMRSDIRFKENVSEVGLSKSGFKIYEFNYKNDDTRYRGAMAQDVITKLPEAIETHDGYLYVDYDMIDINMEVI